MGIWVPQWDNMKFKFVHIFEFLNITYVLRNVVQFSKYKTIIQKNKENNLNHIFILHRSKGIGKLITYRSKRI